MMPALRSDLIAEKATSLATINAMRDRIARSQEEIDLLAARCAAIDAALAEEDAEGNTPARPTKGSK